MTGALLTRVAAAFHGGVNDVLLTALVMAVADWCRRRDLGGRGSGHALLLDLEGHGRDALFTGVDVSRTVGWFTCIFPVRLDPGGVTRSLAGPRRASAEVLKEQLRALPDHGLGYGLLRYLNRADGGSLPA